MHATPKQPQIFDLNKRGLAEIVRLAKRAGEAILSVYRQQDFAISYKADRSPLTQADLAAHHLIADALKKRWPGLPVLTEESTTVPYRLRREWESYWLVDPLDGTKEFVKRSDEFTVNIALIRCGVAVMGVVYAPAFDISYYAAEGMGAFKQRGDGEAAPIAVSDYRGRRLKIALGRSHIASALSTFLEKLPPHELIRMGSSLKLCLVAEGAADLYPRLGRTMEWDTAAAHAIVNEAGGSVTNSHGKPLLYNKADLANPDFFVRGNPPMSLKGLFPN